jgi:hypothetical protein
MGAGVPLSLRECNALWLRRKYNYAQCVVSAQGLEGKTLVTKVRSLTKSSNTSIYISV